MSLFRLAESGWRFFDKFYNPLSKYSKVAVMKPHAAQSKFFSFFASHNSLKSNKSSLMPFTPLVFNFRGMKVRGELQLRCKDCYFERKDGILYVSCSSYPRHKQRAKVKREKYSWILTCASQSKFRPY